MNDPLEYFRERAAIMQFDGGLDRSTADWYAHGLTVMACERSGTPRPKDSYFYALRQACGFQWSDVDGISYESSGPAWS